MRLTCLCLLASGCYLLSGVTAWAAPAESAPAQVWVARRGWHIDLGLAVDGLSGPLTSVAAHFPAARFIFFGFGDRRYLTAKRHRASTLAAALWPGAGLTLVTAVEGPPQQAFGEQHALALTLNENQMRSLQDFIWGTFATTKGAAHVIEPGPYEGSLYFEALPRYSGLHTCNTWAAEGLAAAHLPIHPRFVVLAGQLWSQAKKLKQADQTRPSLAGIANPLLTGGLCPVLTDHGGM